MEETDITDDAIRLICDEMSIPTLSNFILTNKRNYEVCSDILKRKKNKRALEIAQVLQNRRMLMKYDAFKYIIDHNIELDIDLLKESGPGILGSINEDLYILNGYDDIFNAIPQSDIGTVTPITRKILDINSLSPEHIRYIQKYIDAMMKPTYYVAGLNGDKIKTIEIQYDEDALDLSTGFIHDYFDERYAWAYYNMMVARYVL